MTQIDRTIATRALNYLRLVHAPSYVGLRLLLQRSAFTSSGIAISTLVEELAISQVNRIFEVKRFKKIDEDGVTHFRDYSIPSPTHALAEAYSIFHLTRIGVLKRQPNVFSYRPAPAQSYPRNYEHFGGGYADRNEAVRAALVGGRVALIFDMKNCYPSVDGNAVLTRILDQMRSSDDMSTRQQRVIEHCAKACLGPGGGLRIGPDMSHLMADLSLQKIDRDAAGLFAGYFRYVDDVVVVCDEADVSRAMDLMSAIAEGAGFELNRDKTAVATAAVWNEFRNPFTPSDGSFDPLSVLKFRIKLFLGRHPERSYELASSLEKEGIYLPIVAFQRASLSDSWRESIRHLWQRQWGVLLRHWFDSVEAIVEASRNCQALLRKQALGLTVGQAREHKLSRRWQVQHARFVMNRAMYFLSKEELAALCDFSAEQPELAETSAVLAALARDDYSRVAAMPGPAASAAAQLASTRGAMPRLAFPPNTPPDTVAEILAQFAVRGFDQPVPESAAYSDDALRLVRFATGDAYGAPQRPHWTYGGEMESLGVSTTSDQRARLASSRMFESEGVMLEALALSSAYGS